MRQLSLNVPSLRQAFANVRTAAKVDTRQEQPKAPRELATDELRQVSGGAPRNRW